MPFLMLDCAFLQNRRGFFVFFIRRICANDFTSITTRQPSLPITAPKQESGLLLSHLMFMLALIFLRNMIIKDLTPMPPPDPYAPSMPPSLIGGAALAAQMGDPLLAHRLNRDPVVNEEQGRFGVPGILQSIYGNGIAVRRWQTEAGVYNGRPFAID